MIRMPLSRTPGILAAAVALLGVVAGARAAEISTDRVSSPIPAAPGARLGAVDPRPETFGAGTNVLRFPAFAFYPIYQDGTTTYFYYGMQRWQGGGSGDFAVPLQLPSGARIFGIELDARDINEVSDVCAFLIVGDPTTGMDANFGGPCTAGTGENQSVYQDFTVGSVPVDNLDTMYEIHVSFGAHDQSNRLYSVAVFYQLQVSAAPAVASFVDVPTTSPIFKFVEALKASGITAGCDATHYCPNNPLTRGQMAVFLATALGLHWE